ncbi:hypothetical protein K9L27_00060 [Candidatus Gracilibacteria bacterium]|nr:hypothetical protein [Candidatus Gracilibacteria bacterium]
MWIRFRFIRHRKNIAPLILILIFGVSYLLYVQFQKTRTFSFSHEIVTNMTRDQAWDEISQEFQSGSLASEVDSSSHGIVQLSSQKLSEGGALVMKYKLFFLEKVQEYKISQLQPGRSIVYETSDKNPIQGHVEIHVEDAPEGKAKIRWSGEFSYQGFSPLMFFLKYYASEQLLPALQEKFPF